MLQSAVLFLSDDSHCVADADGFGVRVCSDCDRDRAGDQLASGRFRAICIDRRDLARARADVAWLRRRRNRLPVVALVEAAELQRAVDLFGIGVNELVVRSADGPRAALARLDSLARRTSRSGLPPAFQAITAQSPAMRACLELAEKASGSEATVLLQGETGTGKEVLARAIHRASARARQAFVALNCAAFPETLLESELFGVVRGAFTGATRDRAGHFAEADGGTLLLDEVGETSLGFQVKLLRALQEGAVRPLGSSRERRVDVRVIAATNRELERRVESGEFRRDLYYRLHVFPIHLPPLRARTGDVGPLARGFLERHHGASPSAPSSIAPDALRLLETYAWPGNVRELENEIARVVAASQGESELSAAMLAPQIQGLAPALPLDPGAETLRETMRRFEIWVLERTLERHGGRRIASARALGITREALYKKLKRYRMQ